MTLAQLTYLVALDTYRHFRKAAAHCKVAQPSLSAQIRKLEEELEVVLFDRDKKPLAPTPIGEQVIAQARIVLAEADGLRHLVHGATGEPAGTLRVGILPSLAPYVLPRLVARFPDRYPNVTLIFEEMPAPRILELIRRDALDAGVVTTSSPARGFLEDVLFDEPLVAYVAETHRLQGRHTLRPSDLSVQDLWLPGEGDDLWEQAIRLCGLHSTEMMDQKALQFAGVSLETLKRLVEQGQGMVLLPWLAVQGNASYQQALVKPFAPPQPMRTVRMVYTRALTQKHLVHAVMAEIRDVVAPLLPAPRD